MVAQLSSAMRLEMKRARLRRIVVNAREYVARKPGLCRVNGKIVLHRLTRHYKLCRALDLLDEQMSTATRPTSREAA